MKTLQEEVQEAMNKGMFKLRGEPMSPIWRGELFDLVLQIVKDQLKASRNLP